MLKNTLSDFKKSFVMYRLIHTLAWSDVRQRYRRSALGPFWITISMAVMIITMGFVFGRIFSSPISNYIPFLSVGIILWSFITSTLNEGCESFIIVEDLIKNLPLPLSIHVYRVVWRNFIIFCHNILILPIIFLIFSITPNFNIIYIIPAILFLLINLLWIVLFLSIVCTRYRDLSQIVSSLLQIAFYVTPIMWQASLINGRAAKLIQFNPLFHIFEIVRSPLLGKAPAIESWCIVILIAFCGAYCAFRFYAKFKFRITYWL